jgi:Flp pilus assembly protein TadB
LRAFNPKTGLVCSLTNEKPTFLNTCPDFKRDASAAERLEFRESMNELNKVKREVGGLHEYGIKSPLAAGIILIVLSIVWLVVGVVAIERLFYYPIILFFFGLYRLYLGFNKLKRTKNDLLDQI